VVDRAEVVSLITNYELSSKHENSTSQRLASTSWLHH